LGASEMKGFVFCVVFMVMFSAVLGAVPTGLEGSGSTPDLVVPVDPSLVTGFSEVENWTRASYTAFSYTYDNLGGRDWVSTHDDTEITIIAKVKILGFLWLGALNPCKFISPDGVDRGATLSFTEIDADDTDGAVRYDLRFSASGDNAGKLVIWWNTTAYPDINDAWTNNNLNLLHGMGIEDLATNNIVALLLSLLFLQLPDVPVLIGLILATGPWACIIYIIYYIITSVIPFVGGG